MIRTVSLFLIFAFGNFFSSSAQTKAEKKLKQFSWLIGFWESPSKDAMMIEQWKLKDGEMIGKGSAVRGSDTIPFEKLRIATSGDSILYVAQVLKNQAVVFVLKEHSKKQWVFENEKHDFPQKIIYKRTGNNKMETVVTGVENGEPSEEVYKYEKKE